ncbi:hypothetical protein Q4566_08835 [Tamlana sp. 2_MG-2023]|uniref:hypothetical protein n=1 Tax=unclassified Tamlana TaxID=2614803 RepID=UPI0026E13A59|nr:MULTISPECIES: hypothetical protein [unclassified Tamlana]MDO6760300.1 hypothetical protein [Tamlana sp. 2_MG-2023]MDO6790002.1 hypothetical protein [Tamlana sp. 1_MG-2023]
MKNTLLFACLAVLFFSCKDDRKPLTVAEKIAKAHGFEHWKKVSEIQFTFNVDKDSMHFDRVWAWKPKVDQVTIYKRRDSVQYFRSQKDSTTTQIDRGFINDKFWLLFPFQLVWDSNLTFSDVTQTEAPISKSLLNKITVTYPDQGGYTPGDAYDIFYSDDYIIQEWIYRKGNQEEPSMVNTFENYKDFNGLKLALEHKKETGTWSLNFSNVKVISN